MQTTKSGGSRGVKVSSEFDFELPSPGYGPFLVLGPAAGGAPERAKNGPKRPQSGPNRAMGWGKRVGEHQDGIYTPCEWAWRPLGGILARFLAKNGCFGAILACFGLGFWTPTFHFKRSPGTPIGSFGPQK